MDKNNKVYEMPNTLERTFVAVDYGQGRDLAAYVICTYVDGIRTVIDTYWKNLAGFKIRKIKL